MSEMIIPGTYITVRAEGLISAGRIATGIVGVVGTAARGPVGVPITLSGFAQARELFGLPDNFTQPEDGSNPLTLVRALEQVYNNGASTVVAVRTAGSSQASASFLLQDASSKSVALLTANTPGTWGNKISAGVSSADSECRIADEVHDTAFDALNYAPIVPSAENRLRLVQGVGQTALNLAYKLVYKNESIVRAPAAPFYKLAHPKIEKVSGVNRVQVFNTAGELSKDYSKSSLLYNSATAPGPDQVNVNTDTGELTFGATPPDDQKIAATYASSEILADSYDVVIQTWDGKLTFNAGAAPNANNQDKLVASYLVSRDVCQLLTLGYDTVKESYIAPDGKLLAQQVNASSVLVSAEADKTNGGHAIQTGVNAYFGSGSNTKGRDGADAGADEYALGLESLANQLINIVVLAGQDAQGMGSVLESHLRITEGTDFERIGVIGAPGSGLAQFLGHTLANGRIIVVAPGMVNASGQALPPAYTAAAVAGLISSLPVQTSLTNKTLNIPRLATPFNRGEQAQLIKRNVLAVINKEGLRVLKGLTTEGEGQPFSSIPTRRIVDYAKYGVRSAANPYIGRLNNSRVRSALQATLEGFLTRMVEDEALTGFELEVSATRAQEIAGEVSVVMTLQPTFSIDYIRVVMNLK